MSILLEQLIEDLKLKCSRCSGEALIVIKIDGQFVCQECANGRRECA